MNYTLTLYFYPSPAGVDWRSPHHLARSSLINALTFKPRTIGHVSVCLEGPGEKIWTGMAAMNQNDNRRLILIEQMGLGVLFHKVPGYAEAEDKLGPELQKRLRSGFFSFLKFQLNEANYRRTKLYLEEYFEKNIAKWYGLPLRPRYEEGAGCSAFAASVLEVAGLMSEDFKKQCSGRVRIPAVFLGELKGYKVPIWKLLIPSIANLRWAKPEEKGRDIFFWDPDMMHRWVLKTWDDLQRKPQAGFQAVKERNAKGILADSSKILPIQDPFWLS